MGDSHFQFATSVSCLYSLSFSLLLLLEVPQVALMAVELDVSGHVGLATLPILLNVEAL